MNPRWNHLVIRAALAAAAATGAAAQATDDPPPTLKVGFAKQDITPDPTQRDVWLAGYGQNRKAEGIHDPLFARVLTLHDGQRRIGLVSVDLIGFMYPDTKQVRAQAAKVGLEFEYILVAATHNHEGPDTMGLWGPSPVRSGVDRPWLDGVIVQIVQALGEAVAAEAPAVARYGTARSEELLHDSRLPIVKDDVLRTVRWFHPDGRPLAGLVQWNCHPENMGSKNQQITADFCWATVRDLETAWECPVVYVTGALGGLMSAPEGLLKGRAGHPLREGDFEFAEVYGAAVADLAKRADAQAQPLTLTPLAAFAKPIALPLSNPTYKLLKAVGVLKRDAFEDTGDPYRFGPVTIRGDLKVAVETEVAYLRLGELHVAAIPGELYPELVNGRYQEPVEPNVDFPDAPLEEPLLKLLPGDKVLILGLANDEIGYIIPKRQWDDKAPFAYGRDKNQYGEINSVGPEAAPVIHRALADRIAEARAASQPADR